MNSRPTLGQWLQLVLSAVLLIAAVYGRQSGGFAKLARDAELDQLRAEQHRLAACDPDALRAAQAAVVALRGQAAVNEGWPEGWIARAEPSAEGSGRSRWRLTPRSEPTWPAFAQTVTALAGTPGRRIVALEVRSRGTLTQREIAAVEILLEQPTATPFRRHPSASAEPPGSGQLPLPSVPTPGGPGPVFHP